MTPYTRINLERLTFLAQTYVSKELVDEFALAPSVRVMEEYACNALIYQLRQEVLSQHLDRATVRYPENWREGAKEALYTWLSRHWPWFGEYAAERWAVRYRVVEIDVKALYPKIAMPEHRSIVTVLRREG